MRRFALTIAAAAATTGIAVLPASATTAIEDQTPAGEVVVFEGHQNQEADALFCGLMPESWICEWLKVHG